MNKLKYINNNKGVALMIVMQSVFDLMPYGILIGLLKIKRTKKNESENLYLKTLKRNVRQMNYMRNESARSILN